MLSIRKIGVIGRTYRNLTRYRQIIAILIRYGFGDLIERLKIDQYIEVGLQMLSRKERVKAAKSTRMERIRMALQELGPTYIKLGQILSTRPDLIPYALMQELTKLQDKIPPFAYHEVCEVFQKDLNASPQDLFERFDETPFASASIGQVHKARLKSGDDVAVKVQRPGVDKTIEVDLEIMLHLATLAERHIEELSLHRPIKIVEEFARTLENEIDYQIEAANMERIGEQFIGNSTVYIPKVYRDTTTSRILTTEYVEGIKISDTERLKAEGYDCSLITERGATISLQQIFEYGFFHADPHPGNIFVLPENVICLLDFGMVGIVDRNTREDFVALVHSIIRRDETRVAQVLLKLTLWEERPEARAFERDIADFLGQHLYKPLKEISLARLLTHLLETATRHRLRIPPDIFLMMKALSNVEGVARLLDPEFDLISLAEPYVKKIMAARVAPERLADD